MNTFTRSSLFTTSRVGPSRLASTGVRVFVAVRWTFLSSSGAFVSSGPGRGAWIASVIAETLFHDRRTLVRLFGVRLLQSLRDKLHPPELGEAGAAHDHPASEREPRLERSA